MACLPLADRQQLSSELTEWIDKCDPKTRRSIYDDQVIMPATKKAKQDDDVFIYLPKEGNKTFVWLHPTGFYKCSVKDPLTTLNRCVHSSCRPPTVLVNTLFYGSLLHMNFICEDIFIFNSRLTDTIDWSEKLDLFQQLFIKFNIQAELVAAFKFTIPFMSSKIPSLPCTLPYSVYAIKSGQDGCMYKNEKFKNEKYKNEKYKNGQKTVLPKLTPILETPISATPIQIQSKMKLKLRTNTLSENIFNFLVKADSQADTYHLFCQGDTSLVDCGLAYIPSYKCSVMMNQYFRRIKENEDLDLLETSDLEDEFEDVMEDKFLQTDNVPLLMSCAFIQKFKRWQPLALKYDVTDRLVTYQEIKRFF